MSHARCPRPRSARGLKIGAIAINMERPEGVSSEHVMKRTNLVGIVFLLLVCACGPRPEVVFQTSTIDALLAGVYDGDLECRQLLRHGDLGIGTFDGLDGEMVLLSGTVYQVKADGKVYRPALSERTPFATVCRFRPQMAWDVEHESDDAAVKRLIDQQVPNPNVFVAVHIKGRFKTMHTRSVPRQNRPYPPLDEVARNQPEFHMQDIAGDIVGFRCPAYVKGVNVPGYHLHFLSEDRTRGGHILGFELAGGRCEVSVLTRYFLRLPEDVAEFAETDLSQDRSRELEQVEMESRGHVPAPN